MIPSSTTARPLLARRLLPPALLVLSALALMLAIAASTMPAVAGVPAAALQGNAVPVAASATPAAECVRTWDVLYTPSPGTSFNTLYAIEDVSPDEIWAVGEADGNRALVERWDGTEWSVIPVPEVVSSSLLYDVSARGPQEMWAVGKTSRQDGMHATTLRWDGSQWNVVPNPVTPSLGLNLYGVEAISSTLAWAVGNHEAGTRSVPMALSWDGTTWTRVPVPDSGFSTGLSGVSATGPNDVWAVGSSTLVMHWDGSAWTQIPTGFAADLYDVVAISPTDVWAVGYCPAGGSGHDAVILHWDGTTWTQHLKEHARLTGIDARGSNDVWVVGGQRGVNDEATLVMHWDGSAWTEVPSFERGFVPKRFFDIALVNDHDLWAVGHGYRTSTATTFAARYSRTCPQPLACQTGWNIVRSPDPNPNFNILYAVDSTASNDVWVAGTGGGGLIRQWDGSHWEVHTGAAMAGAALYGIKAFSPSNVWAVGSRNPSGQLDLALPRERTLPIDRPAVGSPVIMHYDGASWTYTMTPTIGGGRSYDVDGVSPDDLWAVGMEGNNTLIMHWDGATWSRFPGPPGVLHDVKAVASDFVWAVGSTSESAPGTTLILKWDGQTWTSVSHPAPGWQYVSLESVDASGPNFAVAVGYSTGNAGAHAIYWDGIRWNRSAVQSTTAILTGVSVLSPTSAWAVGFKVSGGMPTQTAAYHWDGSAWTEAPMPAIQAQEVELFDVTAISDNELWAAGHARSYIGTVSSLVERYMDTCQIVTPTPSATANSTSTSTHTPTQQPPTASVTPTPRCTSAWELEDTSNDGGGALFGMDDVAPDDIWAVGIRGDFSPVIRHFDGTGWTVITPTGVITGGMLRDVSAVSSNDVWAVGDYSDGTGGPIGAILRYTGTQWTRLPYPEPAPGDVLYSVDAVSSNEVWAVGANESLGGPFPLVLRWNGTTWTRAAVPSAGRLHAVTAVDTITATQLWVVGVADPGPNQYPIITHYDGTQWSTISVALTGALYNIAAVSPTDIWAVGTSAEPTLRTLVMHYDGNTWTRSPAPFVGELWGIHARSASDIWATGSSNYTQDSGGPTRMLHWDGTSWTAVQSPLLYSGGGVLYDVRMTSPSPEVWAVGLNSETLPVDPLIAHYHSVCPQPLACQTGWNVVDTIDINPDSNVLLGIDASAPDDVWAVGMAGLQGMASHWNGSYWLPTSISDTPDDTILWGVSAVAPDDVWAVGSTQDGAGAGRPLDPREWREVPLWETRTVIVHWDGTEWTRVPSPNPNPGLENTLYGVDGTGPDDAWAVGVTNFQGLILRWDGSSWTQVPLPSGVQVAYLQDVEAITPENVWAVGATTNSALSRTVILHWDGTAWTRVPSPNIDLDGGNYLESIHAIAPDDIWTVGAYEGSAGNGSLTLHWDGTTWTHVQAPSIGLLTSVSGSASNDVWAIGPPITSTLSAVHWNGSVWSVVNVPAPGVDYPWLYAIVSPSQNEVWAVGLDGGLLDSSSLIERYVGTCQTVTPTPITTTTAPPTRTPTATRTSTPTSTRTGTPATATPTPNVQLCNPNSIIINDWATATPYPSNVNVSGVNGTVANVSITLLEFQHGFYDDVDILLTGPLGQSVILMSDAGGTCIETTTLQFQDGAPLVPDEQCPPGQGPYGPSNYTSGPWPDNFPTPAPEPPYGSELSVFNGTDPNGIWSLYVVDDFPAFVGEIEDGWCLNITTVQPGPSPTPTGPPATPTPTRTHTPSITPTVAACANNWQRGAWMPTGVCCYAHAQSGNDLYVMGGNGASGYSNRMYRYNAQFDVWTRLADLPVAVNNAAAAMLDGRIYFAGGFNNAYSSGFYIYDIASNEWSAGAPLPTGLTAAAAGAHAGKVYVAGGFPNTTALYIYNITTNSWSIGPPLPQPYSYGGFVQAGSSLYMVSGSITQRIDLAGGGWSAGPALPVPREHLALASDGARLFAIGGNLGNGNFTNRVDELPLASWPGGSWTPSPAFLPVAIAHNSAGFYTTARAGGEIWSTGGSEWVGDASMEHTFRPIGCPTATPTSTPGTCTLNFADVPLDNTFYPFVRCLACRGIVSGYMCGGTGEPCNPANDPYFRPNNYVTRGQLAKIVSESAGFDEEVPPSQWTFTDVPYGSTFWVWVERLASRQVMAGYACGGPNEPCDGQNRPYFRPNSGATRGQLTKIVSNAARFYDLIPQSRYAFTDVPYGSTFWLYIERLLLNRPGVMSGYQCGGPGEPCDEQNRPYFRPNNPLTRGQTAKIVASTFFPACDPARR